MQAWGPNQGVAQRQWRLERAALRRVRAEEGGLRVGEALWIPGPSLPTGLRAEGTYIPPVWDGR